MAFKTYNGVPYVDELMVGADATVTGLSVSKTDAMTTALRVKNGAGRVHGFRAYNPGAADAWLHFYNVTTSPPVPGTTTRYDSIWVPAGGAVDYNFSAPLAFDTGIGVGVSTTLTGAGAPATGLLVSVYYI